MPEPHSETPKPTDIITAQLGETFGIIPQVIMAKKVIEKRGDTYIDATTIPFKIANTYRGKIKLIGYNDKLPEPPLSVHVELNELTREQISGGVDCYLHYKDKTYKSSERKMVVRKRFAGDVFTMIVEGWENEEDKTKFFTFDHYNDIDFDYNLRFSVRDSTIDNNRIPEV